VIEIRDAGGGIDQKNISKVFEPFYTTKQKGKGTGLGLSMVYNTVREHGGAIYVESEIDKGSTFSFYFPLCDEAVLIPDVEMQKNTERLQGSVLLVDDEELVLQVTSLMLEALGCQVTKALGGDEAIHIFSKEHDAIDLIILDLIMPGKSGADAFSELRQISTTAPIFISSGYSFNTNIEELLNEGAKGFIPKPYTSNALFQHISNHL